LVKVAVELENALERRRIDGAVGCAMPRVLAQGLGWSVADVVCTSGPGDRRFEEQHSGVCIAVVVAGTFQYRSGSGDDLMTPGSLLLGNPGQCFDCGHDHGRGDRCLSFWFSPDYFEQIAADAVGTSAASFAIPRVPPMREMAPVVADGCRALATSTADLVWEELGLRLAASTLRRTSDISPGTDNCSVDAVARVVDVVRHIDTNVDSDLTLETLAANACLSPYHFLRTFERVTGVTPHQYVQRARLREAASRIADDQRRIIDIALDCGFGDVSNFNRAFRAEFGVTPRAYRRLANIRA
jgi:AraC-like DNA-binding protein